MPGDVWDLDEGEQAEIKFGQAEVLLVQKSVMHILDHVLL